MMYRTKKIAAFIFFLTILSSIHAGNPKIDFLQYSLDNGLHVILHQDNSTPNIVVNIMYHVGSKNEHPERTGFAHLFEHLMFEGSRHIGRGEFDLYTERAGGTNNAFTSFDVTNYYVYMPSNQLELGLWLESERLLHPVIDSISIATQKDVVTEEMKQIRDNRPYGALLLETLSRAFTEHPYRSDILGQDAHIRNATQEDILSFHDMYYVPNNAVLVIAGDIDPAETIILVEHYFGDIARGEIPPFRPDVFEPIRTTEVRDTVYDDIQLPMVLQAYHIPAQGTPDYYVIEMINNILAQGQSSRLYRRMIVEEQVAMQVSAMPLGLEDPGLCIISALPNMGADPSALETIISEELKRLRKETVSGRELQKVKNQMESSLINSNARIAQRATNLATYHTLYGDATRINTELERYLAVTPADIQRVAQQYFREDNRVVLYFMPRNQQSHF